MKYDLHFDHHRDFNTIHLGDLAPRAYAIPFSTKAACAAADFRTERAQSDMVTALSGDWDFHMYKTNLRMPARIDTDKVKFDSITVPSTWQRTGYQPPVYLNCPYEFKTFEPEIPNDMPVGLYRKKFTLDSTDGVYILSLLGVASCADVYLNGAFVGYREGTHNTFDYDISRLVKAGENELVVVVFKWCNGSFLEAQDMFRENGIFRDVLLYHYGDSYLYDYRVDTDKVKNGYDMTVSAEIAGDAQGKTVTAALYDGDTLLAEKTLRAGKASFKNLKVKEWSAELPNVYTLYLTLCDKNGELMTVKTVTGFKHIHIDGAKFYFNDRLIKIKGVNHHDSSLKGGYVMTVAELEQDVRLMKAYNVNCVRTSHYPPDPIFLYLCDVYGLYIVDEADIETHGCGEMARDVSYISSQKKWAAHYVDRVRRMYFRDRNHPGLLMWSLGNEAGGHACQDAEYAFLKSMDHRIPVHYEHVIHTSRMHYDVISHMYSSIENVHRIGTGKRLKEVPGARPNDYKKFPFFQCEYAHAMGVGPGCLEEYMQAYYAYDNVMGGCIWEWSDHTVLHENDGFKYKYTYGGDHGEKQHDGNFCVDGLFYADRRPHTGALEMRNVYRPLRASLLPDGKVEFWNTNRFRASDYLTIRWTLTANGAPAQNGELRLNIPAEGRESVALPLPFDKTKDAALLLEYYDGDTCMAEEQLILNDVAYAFPAPIGDKAAVWEKDGRLTVEFDNGRAVFDKKTGFLTSYQVNGAELINRKKIAYDAFRPNFFRAFNDNDMWRRNTMRGAGLPSLQTKAVYCGVEIADGSVCVEVSYRVSAKKTVYYYVNTLYTISASGALTVSAMLAGASGEAYHDIPRFGVLLELPKQYEHVEYYGMGPYENLPDFDAQCHRGVFKTTVSDMFEHYVYPQDNGNRGKVKYLKLTDENGKGFSFYAADSFSFSAHHTTQEIIDKATHDEEVTPVDATVLSLDGFVRGVGTESCGPDTLPQYRADLEKNAYTLTFTVVPEV
ncbi:MAG: hypothetical protein IJ766_03555 [Clostridia bacterium]|nr:hypothetical protein [Clostridia bacterium]